MRAIAATALTTTALAVCAISSACDDGCCTSDSDCAAGLSCFEAVCALRCEVDATCGEGSRCDDGVCSGATGVDPGCAFVDEAG